jgi:hypothetical protein
VNKISRATSTAVLLFALPLSVSLYATDEQGTLYPEGAIDKQALETNSA